MESYISDAALFLKHIEDKLAGMCSTNIYDTRHAGTKYCQELTTQKQEKLM